MEKTYDPQGLEQRIYAKWEAAGHFAAGVQAADDAAPYCIMLPPPNVTGSLHMGHAFQHTIMDALTRYHRMKGDATLWQPGTDHAGIATQMVVERQLNADGISRHDLGREKFLDKVWQWKGESGGTITRQMRRLGTSVDWERERFTMDDGLSDAVKETFVRLHEDGLIYRGTRLVNWDPQLETAVSDLEVLSEEENGHLWHFRYPLTDGSGHLVVATTRPETMLGDTAVAVHPEDERYQALIGKTITLPLTNREIPIIADDYVDPEFGTGCVKITPAHDFNDYAMGERHALPKINIFTSTATINDNAPEAYRGMDRYVARKQIVADLEAAGLLDKIADHKLMVPRGDRTNAVIEPFLTDQWFVNAKPLADKALEVVRNGQMRFVPKNWENTYFQWLDNIQDWCISRQLWWGHRIPAWYDEEGNVYVGRSEDEVREKYASSLTPDTSLRQDEDVLDTWFSSALWPFSTLGWPEKTPELARYYPTSVLVTGFDIIFFWVARMVMMGLHFLDAVPFKDVYITGLIRDGQGHKMSKSKGNVLDPIDLIDGISLDDLVAKRTANMMQPKLAAKIEKQTRKEFPEGIDAYGTDAMRFTFAALASTGRDIRFDMGRIAGYRNFCNKLWNATRYVLMNTEDYAAATSEVELSTADRWIISRLQQAEATVSKEFDAYRFDLAASAAYDFVWHSFCDWYLELSKAILNSEETTAAQKAGTQQTMLRVLETTLRLLHPLLPFITEELWQTVAPLADRQGETVSLAPYPCADDSKMDSQAEAEIDWAKAFISGVRQIRSEMNIPPSKALPVLLQDANSEDLERLKAMDIYVKNLARIESVDVLEAGTEAPQSATALIGKLKILVPMAGLIDVEAELARLSKQIAKLEQGVKQLSGKLSNDKFVANAPAAVVAKEREKLAEMQTALDELTGQAERTKALA